jgi:fused-like protein
MDDNHFVQQIGEGSFGRFYKARDCDQDDQQIETDGDDVTSLRREIQIIQKVAHPNIMKMVDGYISELVRGFCSR